MFQPWSQLTVEGNLSSLSCGDGVFCTATRKLTNSKMKRVLLSNIQLYSNFFSCPNNLYYSCFFLNRVAFFSIISIIVAFFGYRISLVTFSLQQFSSLWEMEEFLLVTLIALKDIGQLFCKIPWIWTLLILVFGIVISLVISRNFMSVWSCQLTT